MCIYLYVYIYIHIRVFLKYVSYIYIYVYTDIYTSMNVRVNIYIYSYAHTYGTNKSSKIEANMAIFDLICQVSFAQVLQYFGCFGIIFFCRHTYRTEIELSQIEQSFPSIYSGLYTVTGPLQVPSRTQRGFALWLHTLIDICKKCDK